MPFESDLDVHFLRGRMGAVLDSDLVYRTVKDVLIVVRSGFETDFASVPQFLGSLIPKVGRLRDAAVVHDWLYRGHEGGLYARSDADRIFREAMRECGVWWWRRWMAWAGVRLFGRLSWEMGR